MIPFKTFRKDFLDIKTRSSLNDSWFFWMRLTSTNLPLPLTWLALIFVQIPNELEANFASPIATVTHWHLSLHFTHLFHFILGFCRSNLRVRIHSFGLLPPNRIGKVFFILRWLQIALFTCDQQLKLLTFFFFIHSHRPIQPSAKGWSPDY